MKQILATLLLALTLSSAQSQGLVLRDVFYSVQTQTDYYKNIGVGFEVGLRDRKEPWSISIAGSMYSLGTSSSRSSFYLLQGKVGYRLTKPESKVAEVRAIATPMISQDRFTLAAGGRFTFRDKGHTEYFIEPLVDAGGRFYLGLGIGMFRIFPRTDY
jgi:hypothetical protein